MKPAHCVFLGVTDVLDPRVETPEEIRDLILEAAEYFPPTQLGTTDDCGFSPFADDTSTSRDTAFAKIKARVNGTRLAQEVLSQQKTVGIASRSGRFPMGKNAVRLLPFCHQRSEVCHCSISTALLPCIYPSHCCSGSPHAPMLVQRGNASNFGAMRGRVPKSTPLASAAQ